MFERAKRPYVEEGCFCMEVVVNTPCQDFYVYCVWRREAVQLVYEDSFYGPGLPDIECPNQDNAEPYS